MSESRRSVKLKDMKKEIFPLMLLSCKLGYRQTSTLQGLHIAVATHKYLISLKSGVHPPDYAAHIPPYNPPSITPIVHHFPCMSDIHTSFFVTVIHSMNAPLPLPTYTLLTHSLSAILSLSILSPFVTPHNSIILAF